MKYLMILLLALFALDGMAQSREAGSAESNGKNILGWLSDHGIQVRRAFDGTRNEGKSALFQYSRDFEADSNSFSQIDMAVKIKEIAMEERRLYFYPVIEWHRKTVNEDLQDEDSYNKISASLKGEWGVLDARLTPLLIGSASVKNDFKDEELEGEFRIETTFFSIIEGLPGSNINTGSGRTLLKYYPYFGYEYYTGVIEGTDQLEFFKARIYAELYPLGTNHIRGVVEYTKRWEAGEKSLSKDPEIFSGALNYDLNKYFSISLEYEKGKLPANDFGKTHTLKFGLGLKI